MQQPRKAPPAPPTYPVYYPAAAPAYNPAPTSTSYATPTNSASTTTTTTTTTTTITPTKPPPAPAPQHARPSPASRQHGNTTTVQGQAVQAPRTCANCNCTQTPLWRRSPLGPKTLCNACGVRMAKRRLLYDAHTRSFITVPSPHTTSRRSASNNNAVPYTPSSRPASQTLNHNVLQHQQQQIHQQHIHHSKLPTHSKPPQQQQQQHNIPSPMQPIRKRRPKPLEHVSKQHSGLYYLLAAIDYIETA